MGTDFIFYVCRREYQGRESVLHYLTGIITDLFIDWNKLIGMDGRLFIGTLNELIQSGNLPGLNRLFLNHQRS